MFNRIFKAYKDRGVELHIGNSNNLSAHISTNGEPLQTGGGISITDVSFFFGLAKEFSPSRIFCIGNASGYSALVLAEIFSCPIDVIDAEIEGSCNVLGSKLTREISKEVYDNRIQLHTGFSPQNLGNVAGKNKYDFVFIDGMHTNEQQSLDFKGMQPFVKNSTIFYLHDVGLCKMIDGFNKLKLEHTDYVGYDVDYTSFGCKAMVRNLPQVSEWLSFTNQSPINCCKNPMAYLSK